MSLLEPEFINLEKRLDKSIKWVEKNKDKIEIPFLQAVTLYDMGLDVTQLKIKQ